MRERARWPLVLLAAATTTLASPARAADSAGDDFPRQRDRFMAQRNGVVTVLVGWSALNLAGGALLVADPPWIPQVAPTRAERRAFGVATLAFATANFAFAAAGVAGTSRLRGSLTDVPSLLHERRVTGDFFAVNAGLDMLYITAGALLCRHAPTPILRGFGAGVLAQGGFLIGFDVSATMLYRYGGG